MNDNLDQSYWSSRYEREETQWDVGTITDPLRNYFDQLKNKNIKILIPGAGNGYEAEYLFNQGFSDVTVLDLSEKPLQNLKNRIPGFPDSKLICGDFFSHEGQYDLVVEQTFFCALDPSLRNDYVKQMAKIIRPGGKLAGLLFDAEFEGGPPFGGNRAEYLSLFASLFEIKTMELCYNSLKPRAGRELFVLFVRK